MSKQVRLQLILREKKIADEINEIFKEHKSKIE